MYTSYLVSVPPPSLLFYLLLFLLLLLPFCPKPKVLSSRPAPAFSRSTRRRARSQEHKMTSRRQRREGQEEARGRRLRWRPRKPPRSSEKESMSRPQHLCIRPLNVPDIAQVLGLEMLGFPSHERASALRIEYRLTVCPELCSGLFVREFDTELVNAKELPDHSTIKKETLIGHVIGTKMVSEAITDESMLVPSSFVSVLCNKNGTLKEQYKTLELKELEKAEKTKATGTETTPEGPPKGRIYPLGHQDSGRTIGIHSVVVHPDYRGKKLASLLLKDYLQKMNQQYVADNISLLCLEKLVSFYSGIGFADKGVSACKFAGEEWHDMSLTLDHDEDEEE